MARGKRKSVTESNELFKKSKKRVIQRIKEITALGSDSGDIEQLKKVGIYLFNLWKIFECEKNNLPHDCLSDLFGRSTFQVCNDILGTIATIDLILSGEYGYIESLISEQRKNLLR